jgi:hypothetical protein
MPDEQVGEQQEQQSQESSQEAGAQQEQQEQQQKGPEMFTREEMNANIAKNRRQMQKELKEAQQQATAYQRLQGQVSELLGSGLIDGVEDLSEFRTQAQQTIEQFRTEAEKRETEQKTLEKSLEETAKQADQYKQRYEAAQVNRSIADEAGAKALDEGALELIQMKLSPLSEVQEDGSVLVNWDITDEETGKIVRRRIPVKDAVERMEAHPTKYRGLFRATVNGGTGGEQVDGVRRTSEGEIDLANMSYQQHLEMRKKNPGLIEKALEKQRGALG